MYDSEIKYIDNKDYTLFKNSPFVQLSYGEFAVIRNSFVANLIYNSLRFKLKDVYGRNAQEFFGLYDKDFIEKFLFLRVLKYSFKSSKYICLSEDECIKQANIYMQVNPRVVDPNYNKELMDGYVRYNNKILLFECKAKIISIRALYNDKELVNDIKSDLVKKDGNGTGQLIENCNRLIENRCYWDKNIPRDFKIYPILILDDIGFSAEGFNRFVIESTEEYVNKHTCQVFQFTVLDIDTFIFLN